MPDPNNPDKINQNLHKIFNSKNFEQKLANAGIKTDEFYKKAFKIQTKKDQQKEIKI
jgi:tripartite-type tricarboxylate transporter receptor subunit TctC